MSQLVLQWSHSLESEASMNRDEIPTNGNDPIFETIPEKPVDRTQDLLWWAATSVSVLMLTLWLATSLLGCGDALVSVGPPGAGDDDATDDDDTADDVDADGDGWTVGDGDCDDGDDAVHPDAEEVPYDGIDNDCADGDLVDVDGDGHAATEAGGEDCDDHDDAIHPDAEEQCDGVDHDCDGSEVDDEDGDGFDTCEDCDDDDPDVHPGATETNGDGVDSDCDGSDDLNLGENCYGDPNVIEVPQLQEYSIDWDDASGDVAGNNHYYDDVEFLAVAGDLVTIAMWDWEWGLDPYLYLLDPSCQVVAQDDNSAAADNDDALIEYEIPVGGVYTIIATSAGSWETGDYQLETW